ncbi:hypothetical protein BBP40_010241, partial [Aspergillus hancockii]
MFGESILLNFTAIAMDSPTEPLNAIATQCTLYGCIKTYLTRMRNHTLEETEVDTYHDPKPQYEIHHGDSDGYGVYHGDNMTLNLDAPAKGNQAASTFTVSQADTNPRINSTPMSDELGLPLTESSFPDHFANVAAGLTTYVRK